MSDAPYLTDDAIAAIRRGDEPVKKMKWRKGARIKVADKSKREAFGKVYPSKLQMERAVFLHGDVGEATKGKQFECVIEEVTIQLGPDFRVRVDFLVFPWIAPIWAEDVKGFEKRSFARTRKLWAKYGPFDLHVVTRKRGQWQTDKIRGGNANWRAKQ